MTGRSQGGSHCTPLDTAQSDNGVPPPTCMTLPNYLVTPSVQTKLANATSNMIHHIAGFHLSLIVT
jgi:hypothetical protein